jgi:hypothetical protein
VVRQTASDASGLYRFGLLDFGTYRLEIEAGGFKKFGRDGILLETGETTTFNVTMEVGQLTESVTVTGESPLLRTETGAVGTSVNTQVISELPLIGRNPYSFLKLAAGIQHTGDPDAVNQWDNNGPSNFASSGSEGRSEFLLDGIPNMRIETVSRLGSPPELSRNAAKAKLTPLPIPRTSKRELSQMDELRQRCIFSRAISMEQWASSEGMGTP